VPFSAAANTATVVASSIDIALPPAGLHQRRGRSSSVDFSS